MEIRNSDNINGKGLFSTKKYMKGDIVHILSGEIYDNPTRYTIHIGNNKHIHDEYGIFINHSFNPNICINNNNVIALVDINVNDELMFNYNDSELKMASPFYVNNILVNGKNENK